MRGLKNRVVKLETKANPKSFGVLFYDENCEKSRQDALQRESEAKAYGNILVLFNKRDAGCL